MAMRPGTEAKLLDAADELFFTRGIAATSIDDVLAVAGVSSATLYRGFPSKEALVAAALERRHRRWIDIWDAEIAARTDDRERLLAVFDALEAFRGEPFGSRWCAFLGSAAEYANAPDGIRDAVERDTATLRERLTALARPVVGSRAHALAEQLLLVVTGDLAMRLRNDADGGRTARTIAEALLPERAGVRARNAGNP